MKLSFSPKDKPLFPEMRIFSKVSQVILVLCIASRSKKSSLIRLHLFNWALNEPLNRTRLLKCAAQRKLDIQLWSVDPMLNQAIEYAIADRLVEKVASSYEIAPRGEGFYAGIRTEGLIPNDVEYLEMVGKNITESSIQSIVESWR